MVAAHGFTAAGCAGEFAAHPLKHSNAVAVTIGFKGSSPPNGSVPLAP
jgi:hypothetical protein